MKKVPTQDEIDLLEQALIAWRTRQTKLKGTVSLNAFADYIGASRSIVSMWTLNQRDITERYKQIIAIPLAELVGPKAFEILKVTPSDPDLQRLIQIWKFIPEKIRRGMLQQGETFVENENEENDTNPAKNHT